MTAAFENELRRIVDAVVFQSREAFLFAGRPSSTWMPAHQNLPHGLAQSPVLQSLQQALYGNCYMQPFEGTIQDKAANFSGANDAWVGALSAANTSKERWEEGWQVHQFLPTGQVNAVKRGALHSFWPGEFITRSPQGMAPQPGAQIAVFLARESRSLQPGFYFVFGEALGDHQDEFQPVRYYWNIQQDSAAPLVRTLTTALNKYQVPFKFKILNHPAMLGRSDGAILYVGKRFYRIAAAIAMEVHAPLAAHLGDTVPLFSRRLEKGLAFAEDPGPQESFGMARCRLVAEALLLAFTEGISGSDARLDRVRRHFEAAGTSLERPYLNLASVDPYEFPQ